MSFRTRKNILTGLGALSLLSWILFIYLYYFYFQNVAPTKPNPSGAQIYGVNNHGYVFYLTQEQRIIAFIPCALAIVGSVMLVVLERRWGIGKKLYGERPRTLSLQTKVTAKGLAAAAAAVIGIYLGFILIEAFRKFTLSEMDWNSDGHTSIFEILAAADMDRREASTNKSCTEYYAYKDGLPVKIVCARASSGRAPK